MIRAAPHIGKWWMIGGTKVSNRGGSIFTWAGARRGILLLIGLLAAGCGGNPGATDGGVPLGPTRFSGVVVQSLDPTMPVAGAHLQLSGSDGELYVTQADSQGSYSFPIAPAGRGILTALPPQGSPLAPQAVAVDVNSYSRFSVVIALAPSSLYSQATGVTVEVTPRTLRVGQRASITAMVQGVPAAVHPSLVVQGGVGEVSPDGVFQASRAGNGTITATCGGVSASTSVRVFP